MDSTGSELRVYRLSGAVLQEVARLSPVAPPRAVVGALHAPEVDADHGDGAGAGLFLALVQGGRVVDVARLVFHGGEPSGADGGQDCYSSGTSTSGSAASSGSTEVLPQVSSKYSDDALGSVPLCGGLVMGCEDGQLVNPSRWDGEEEEDWEGGDEGQLSDQSRGLPGLSMSAKGQSSSRWWSGNQDSSSEDGDQDQDDDEHFSSDTRGSSGLLMSAAGQTSASWWSGNQESSSEDGDKAQVQDQEHCDEVWSSMSLRNSCSSLRSEIGEQDEDEDEKRSQKNDNESEQEEKDGCQPIMINLRLWPAQKHALIKVFSGGKWVLTKDYIIIWLKLEDVIEYNLQLEFGASFATVFGFRNTDVIMDFEVNVDCNPMITDLLTLLRPSICTFQILKRVGGGGACKVFKCLFMGKRCALKSLAQKNLCTLEPREIEIISNLKDMNVMIFYQAWIEPWLYKGNAEQKYLFIHLEFCESTLKHALRYENRHWFPDKWLLFKDIVRPVHKLHETCVVHRDLKPDNIFFNSEFVVRIGDFGDSCVGRDELGMYGGGTGKLGTQYYLAEELNSGAKITEKVDVYSLGVILVEIFATLKTVSERNLLFPNLREQGPPDNWEGDRELYDMMTAIQPNDRPSTAQVLDYIALHHSE